MRSFDHDKLLDDVLADESYRAFRVRTLREARREFRSVHRGKSIYPCLAIAAALVVLGVIWIGRDAPKIESSPVAGATQIPPPLEVPPEKLGSVAIVRTTPSKIVIVETPVVADTQAWMVHTRPSAIEINDAQLLALFAGRPAGFFRGPAGKEFVLFQSKN
jgi:hypothetical protein